MENNYTYDITSRDLEHQAVRTSMRYDLSTYVRDLLYNFFGLDAKIEFQGSEDVGGSGYDGIAYIPENSKNPFFPNGYSVWELSNQGTVKTKADADYEKRLPDADPEKVYVQATFRKWDEKAKWAEEKSKDGKWKAVIALDSRDFQDMFNHPEAGSARLRMLNCLGKVTTGIQFAELEWERIYSRLKDKSLSPDVYFIAQARAMTALTEFLDGPDRIKHIRSRFSSTDSKAFLFAFFQHNHERFPSVIVVEKKDVLDHLISIEFSGVIIIDSLLKLSNDDFHRCNDLKNAKILIPVFSNESIKNEVLINKIPSADLTELLHGLGFSEEDARQYSTISNGSITCLRCFMDDSFPASQCQLTEKSYTLLAVASWDGNFSGDIATLERLAKAPYSEIETEVMNMEKCERPFVVGAKKKVSSSNKIEAWFFLAPHITSSFINSFLDESYNILTDINPKWDLDADKRFAAELYNKKAEYSSDIKQGIADTLLHMMVFADRAADMKSTLVSGIRCLFHRVYKNLDTWQKWASLDPVLPFLAEADPNIFLEYLEKTIAHKKELIAELFTEDGDAFTSGGCKHSGLIWALELISCIKVHARRAIDALADLADIDPDGVWQNRPKHSLSRIFLNWLPQTPLNVSDRISVLKSFCENHENIASSIIKSSITARTSGNIYFPKITTYRLHKDTEEERRLYYVELSKLYLDIAKKYPKEIVSQLEHIGFQRYLQFQLYDFLKELDISDWNDSDLLKVWGKVRDDLWAYNQFADNPNWQISSERKGTLLELYDKYKPQNELVLYSKYFEFGLKLPYDDVPADHKQRKIYDEVFQEKKILQFVKEVGLGKLSELIKISEDKRSIAVAIAKTPYLLNILKCLPDFLKSNDNNLRLFSECLLQYLYHYNNSLLKDYICNTAFDDVTKLKVYASLPYDDYTIGLVDVLSDQDKKIYWENISRWSIDQDSQYVESIVKGLLSVGRIRDVANIVWHSIHTFPINFLCEVLNIARRPEYHEFISSNTYKFSEIFKKIYSHSDIENVDKSLMVDLELSYLGLFDRHTSDAYPKFLYENIFSNPQFYLDLVKGAYKNDKMEERVKDPNFAEMSYRILSGINSLPGYQNNHFDASVYKQWIRDIIALSKEQEYFVGTKCALPEMLVRTPKDDEDDIWPHRALREILEELKDPDLETNLAIAIMNSRGVTTRSANEGYARERNEANEYRQKASSVFVDYPRTAIVLNAIADDLDSYADYFEKD